ncbi:MAG: hypothetical protein OIN66_04870 [Candidatus Methanoperedens sp.]|nr:hypothetical protein [Candidatus Methanoperedens sp.]
MVNMGIDMLLSRNIRWCNIRVVAGITMLSLFLLAGNAGAYYPPPALLEIDGNEQSAGIGNSCWKVENQTYLICADTFSINTPAEPLLTRSPFTAHLRLPLQEPPEELGFSAIRVTDDDALNEAVNDFRAWRYGLQGMEIQVPLERESDINLSLEPGLYVLNVFVKWKEKGDVFYGFLVQVYNPAAGVITQAATATESEKSTTSSPNETHNIIPTEKAAGFEAIPGMTILLAVYAAGRKKR